MFAGSSSHEAGYQPLPASIPPPTTPVPPGGGGSGGGGSPSRQPLLPTSTRATRASSPWPEQPGLTFAASSWALLTSARLHGLLLFVPLSLLSRTLGWGEGATFSLSFLALLPLAKVLGTCTEEIALQSSPTIGGLLNVSFGNMVEMILSLLALQKGLVRVVQASLLGSILGNLLLVLGASFLAAGLTQSTARFNKQAAQTSASLMSMAVFAFVIPAAFSTTVKEEVALLNLSRCTAVLLAVLYGLFLIFQLKTHSHLYDGVHSRGHASSGREEEEAEVEVEEEETPIMSLVAACFYLLATTLAVSVCAELLVGSIEGISHQWHLSETFVGMILIPIVGNAAEHVTAITLAMKDKVDLSIAIAVGSSTQISLLVTPICVLYGWLIGQPMSLDLSPFETSILFVSVFVMSGMISDGRTNWLEGCMLMGAYLVIATAFFFLPSGLGSA